MRKQEPACWSSDKCERIRYMHLFWSLFLRSNLEWNFARVFISQWWSSSPWHNCQIVIYYDQIMVPPGLSFSFTAQLMVGCARIMLHPAESYVHSSIYSKLGLIMLKLWQTYTWVTVSMIKVMISHDALDFCLLKLWMDHSQWSIS